MASTGAILYIRPRFSAATVAHGVTGAVVAISSRVSSGKYSSTVIGAGTTSRNRKAMRPDNSVPFMQKNGDGWINNPAWSQWFQYVEQTFLNMLSGPTLPDVADYVTAGQAQAIATSVVQSALSQQANANAQSILTMREVVQTAALPGAVAIPPPQLTPDFGPTGGGE